MTAYYNENNKEAAAWLRELIAMNLIADGEVDDRSIADVQPSDLRGFTQHHFFAGVGGWSIALRNAGWTDDRAICSASLPCQPFSLAGKQLGKADERHLLPHFLELVKACKFPTIVGEQVPGAIKQGWLDDLYDEMEREGYTCGSPVLTAAGAGSPHPRQRIYWVAYSLNTGPQGRLLRGQDSQREDIDGHLRRCRSDFRLDDPAGFRQERNQGAGWEEGDRIKQSSGFSRMGYAEHQQHKRCLTGCGEESSKDESGEEGEPSRPSEVIDWLYCRDEKYRPIKSGIKPLVDGFPRGVVHSIDTSISPNETGEARVMRLKGFGNAIQIDTATAFIKAAMYAMEAA